MWKRLKASVAPGRVRFVSYLYGPNKRSKETWNYGRISSLGAPWRTPIDILSPLPCSVESFNGVIMRIWKRKQGHLPNTGRNRAECRLAWKGESHTQMRFFAEYTHERSMTWWLRAPPFASCLQPRLDTKKAQVNGMTGDQVSQLDTPRIVLRACH